MGKPHEEKKEKNWYFKIRCTHFTKTNEICNMKIGIIGSGAMGTGIAQVALMGNEQVALFDTNGDALERAKNSLETQFSKLLEKGKITEERKTTLLSQVSFVRYMNDLAECDWVIEAIVEDLAVKKAVFAELDALLPKTSILATNTSSLSVTAIASACKHPERVWGIHFFNPAFIMPLVEIIPALQTDNERLSEIQTKISDWGKTPVVTKDLPGFIVNRLARPFYSEALRIYDEGLATFSEIDEAMRALHFKMGPFELMDLIGNDVNYAVTESVFAANYFNPRYTPSTTQKRHVEAGWFGRKSKRGYYSYAENAVNQPAALNILSEEEIGKRILCMLINEAYEALRTGLASAEDLDLAMTKGVNYPMGLIAWGKELGLDQVAWEMKKLSSKYGEDRYRLSPALNDSL
jgi:3-hydroxybutyryl-CoA dehydrogenase